MKFNWERELNEAKKESWRMNEFMKPGFNTFKLKLKSINPESTNQQINPEWKLTEDIQSNWIQIVVDLVSFPGLIIDFR